MINSGSVGGGGGVPVFQPPKENFFDVEDVLEVVIFDLEAIDVVVEVLDVVVVVVVVEEVVIWGQYSEQ